MIDLPNKKLSFEYENGFFLTCDPSRIGKMLAHYELYKQIIDIPGSIVECGVYKGVSLTRFAMFRKLLDYKEDKKILGFDTFETFPNTNFEEDIPLRKAFIDDSGKHSISKSQLFKILNDKNCSNSVELISGDICNTIPEYVEKTPDLKISLLNLDVDIYEPSVIILEYLFPLIVKGGILILDDYGSFPGETKAVDEYFSDQSVEICKLPHCATIHYVIKS
jgi:hypothetical protein